MAWAQVPARLGHVAHYPGSRAEHEDFEMIVIRPTWVRRYDSSTRPPMVVEVTW